MPDSRLRFTPPWSVRELDACFFVEDKNGQALAYVYFEEEPGRRAARPITQRLAGGVPALARALLVYPIDLNQ